MSNDDLSLLERTRKVVKAEQRLTALLEKVEPWIASRGDPLDKSNSSIREHYWNRVRPIPTNMEQVNVILAMARNWASKTSAPAGWDPIAPVIGFATPNPLPHQLRGGALAALQLERATTQKYREQQSREEQEQRDRQQKKEQEEQQMLEEQQQQKNIQQDANAAINPKKRARATENAPRRLPQPQRPTERRVPSVEVTMNLSDSSSDDDDDDDSG